MRISFLVLLLNALIFTQVLSAVDEETQLKSALLKAMKTHDTATVEALSSAGHESIDRDDVLQMKIYQYLDAEREREVQAKAKAEADAIAKKQAEKQAEIDAVAAKKAAEKKAKADALAAKQKAEEAAAAKKAAEQKRAADALAAKKAAEQKAATKAAAAAAVIAAPVVMNDDVEEDIGEEDAAVAEPEVLPVLALTASDKEFVGTWEQISSDKIITLTIEKNTNFTLEQVEDDGTLTITGTWKSEGTMFMLNIKKVQRNVHSRETDIHRIYKVERLSNHRLLLRDKQNRIAYDLKR